MNVLERQYDNLPLWAKIFFNNRFGTTLFLKMENLNDFVDADELVQRIANNKNFDEGESLLDIFDTNDEWFFLDDLDFTAESMKPNEIIDDFIDYMNCAATEDVILNWDKYSKNWKVN